MDSPLVSIIVPVYNVERYIHRAIDSIISQSYKNLEIILVDDGSLDNCPHICDEYALKDNRIKVIHKKNGGLSDARNVGIDIINGEYITFVDSDDYIATNAIERLIQEIRVQNTDALCCSYYLIDSNGEIYDCRKCEKNFKYTGTDAAKLLINDLFPYNFAWAKLYKKKLFEGIRFPVGRLYEDIATIYKVISKADSVYCMTDCLYYYERGREGNITSELNTNKAAWSYYCGCLNCNEQITFCRERSKFNDMLPIIYKRLHSWSKLCIESAIHLGKKGYNKYCHKVKSVLRETGVPLSLRLKLIIHFHNIYYYLYPIIGRNR